MKTSTLPPLRVEPRLRSQAERLLRTGETLSSFIVDAVEERVRNRAMEDEFVRRGLASGERARRSGKYTSADLVVAGLRRRLDNARKAGSGRPARKARKTR
ncbi:MAG TPA: YlcI/YnfO family protein [Myxococcales bacterium]|nr:YlcI/YnfO family protein [Myxococcales bacterium]